MCQRSGPLLPAGMVCSQNAFCAQNCSQNVMFPRALWPLPASNDDSSIVNAFNVSHIDLEVLLTCTTPVIHYEAWVLAEIPTGTCAGVATLLGKFSAGVVHVCPSRACSSACRFCAWDAGGGIRCCWDSACLCGGRLIVAAAVADCQASIAALKSGSAKKLRQSALAPVPRGGQSSWNCERHLNARFSLFLHACFENMLNLMPEPPRTMGVPQRARKSHKNNPANIRTRTRAALRGLYRRPCRTHRKIASSCLAVQCLRLQRLCSGGVDLQRRQRLRPACSLY